MKDQEVYYKREFDTPGWLVGVLVVISIILLLMSAHADQVTMFQSEKPGIYLLTVVCIGLTAYATHIWKWGRKVRWAP